LESKTSQYLRQRYTGNTWTNYVDAIIGITAQTTSDGAAGKTAGPGYLDQGRTFTLLKWQVYWADDNLVQHEVSHLFYADDHYHEPCCVMATHVHAQYWIYEDGLWLIGANIVCAYTAYSWDNDCFTVIEQHKSKYQYTDLPILIDWWDVYEWICVTRYLWLNETTNTIWIEDKGIGMPVGVLRR